MKHDEDTMRTRSKTRSETLMRVEPSTPPPSSTRRPTPQTITKEVWSMTTHTIRTKLNELNLNDRGNKPELCQRMIEFKVNKLNKPIDVAANLWLNEDPIMDNTTCGQANESCVLIEETFDQAGEDDDQAGETSGQAGDMCGQQVNNQNELIILLLGVVEQLSEIVLRERPTMTPPPTISLPTTPDTPTPDMPTPYMPTPSPQGMYSPSKSNDEWTTVPGIPRQGPKNKQSTIECSNIFELLDSIPTETQLPDSPDTSTIAEMPRDTWASSPALQPKNHQNKQRRSNVVVNKYPERDNGWRKTVPGNSSFSDIVKHGKKVALFSDSICNRFSEWKMNSKIANCKVKKKSFPGATALDLAEHHVHPYFKRNSPDTAIIHAGANDILQLGDEDGGLTDELMEVVCTNILTCGMVCKQYGTNRVCISAVLPARSKNYQLSAIHINHKLESMCREVGFDFIRNNNIIYEKPTKLYDGLFYKDGLHLNENGRELLMENFIDYLNNDHYLNNHD